MSGSPKKRARKEAIERGEVIPGETKKKGHVLLRERGGRPPTEAEMSTMERWLETGAYVESAAAAAGLQPRLVREWMRKGAVEPEGPFSEFKERIDLAHEKGIAQTFAAVTRAGRKEELAEKTLDKSGNVEKTKLREDRGDWKADAWRLERLDPRRFAPRVMLEVERELTAVLDAIESVVDAPTYAIILEAIARIEGKGGESPSEPT